MYGAEKGPGVPVGAPGPPVGFHIHAPKPLQFAPLGATFIDEAAHIELLQEEEELAIGTINVKPVTGMTPAQVATELRVLIRDKIRGNIKTNSPKPSKSTAQYRQGEVEMINQLTHELDAIVEEAKLRKPSLTRKRVAEIKAGPLYSLRVNTQRHSESIVIPGPPDPGLIKAVDRAYALVQALPTVDQPTLGKAEQTIRAVTAILKVYYGLDVEGAPNKLPDVMHDLLAAIKPEKVVTSNDPVKDEVGKKVFLPPYTFHSSSGLDITHNYHWPSFPSGKYGYYDDGPGSIELWNDGMCGVHEAVQALVYAKKCFSDDYFTLNDAVGNVVAKAFNVEPLWVNPAIAEEVHVAAF